MSSCCCCARGRVELIAVVRDGYEEVYLRPTFVSSMPLSALE